MVACPSELDWWTASRPMKAGMGSSHHVILSWISGRKLTDGQVCFYLQPYIFDRLHQSWPEVVRWLDLHKDMKSCCHSTCF